MIKRPNDLTSNDNFAVVLDGNRIVFSMERKSDFVCRNISVPEARLLGDKFTEIADYLEREREDCD